ncbi:MAG: sensor histidine kinase [Ruminococcus sp.]|nr:sensor histidine kinase [Ruminococcus sp.]
MRELSLNVMDVAQNSVRAQASLVTISVEESDRDDYLQISVSDNGCGMTEDQVQQVIDPFFTTRTTRKVGLGVPLFKLSAEQTGGSFEIQSTLHVGTTTTARYVKSHVDMTPLGDINDTVKILIQCNPDMDFVFTHTTDLGSFTLDTRELRKVLEGVRLDTPDVLEWISAYLTEQSQIIYGGTDYQ